MLFSARVGAGALTAAACVRTRGRFCLFNEVAFAHPVAFAPGSAVGAEGQILILHGQKLFKVLSAVRAEK